MNQPSTNFYQMNNTIFSYGLKPIPLTVYSYLVSCAGSKGKCWPGIRRIAACCGISETSARQAIKLLDAREFIRKVPTYSQFGNGRYRQSNNTYYILDLPAMEFKQEHKTHYAETTHPQQPCVET